ncbi:spherulation-specific family 4 protein [Streptomyces europaeiscabiei]|uniref:Spherulation-specific family 4 protein n=1 Tax=Streptomyces europaeiscabiei TaxID=146819 RepID=A0AAJ2UM34_9ACTN|nr:spherulation-specific family 4 protein [Streptomyces europaeiscabiei]MDX3132028.1 spherulation-specific family 4 protein [Streptomyces europaeiscabiei]
MPYLTPAPSGIASTGLSLGFGIPGYAHPLVAPLEWGELTRPGTPLHWVVLNVSDGPGSRPDPHCLEAAGRLRNAGVGVLGHLDVTYGARAYAEIASDARRFLDWYRIDGFLLDRCPTERSALSETARTVAALRALLGGGHIVLGHGTHPHPGYAETADQLVTFSGPWNDYRWSQVAEWTADHPPERFCHFVHGVPRGHLDEALRIARWQGAATIYFTDRTDRGGRTDPWETMPGYWDDIVSLIGTGVSE